MDLTVSESHFFLNKIFSYLDDLDRDSSWPGAVGLASINLNSVRIQ